MVKKIVAVVLVILLLFTSIASTKTEKVVSEMPGNKTEISIEQLILNNFVEENCNLFRASEWKILELNEKFVNKIGSEVAPQSCKGDVCWSWQTPHAGANDFDWQVYSSTLPLKIRNIERISKNISQAIRQTTSLRKTASSLTAATQEFLHANFSTTKEKATLRERSITQQKAQEQSIETDVTALFHKYLGMALQGPFEAIYPFCLASAVDLFFKAYEEGRVEDLVEAFVIYKTIKPIDIELSNSKTMLNRAKFLYTILSSTFRENTKRQQEKFAWAQATLFAKLLEWEEFKEVRSIVDDYIDRVYSTYSTLKTSTTKEILQKDEELAALKYVVDKNLAQQTQDSANFEDAYVALATYYHKPHKNIDEIEEVKKQLKSAVESNDVLLNTKFVKLRDTKGDKELESYAMVAVPVVAVLTAVAATLFLTKKGK